jgi:3-methyl-2-oxobutanoate hydroxymethyltransferase
MEGSGKIHRAARILIEDSLILEDAGCYALVLEAIPTEVAQLITNRLRIPVIGIGAGMGCDGQILVTHDLLGLFDRFTPKFAKRYVNEDVVAAYALLFGHYASEDLPLGVDR